MSLKPHQYMLSLNSFCSVFASQYYANICQNSLWDYWKKTTAWKVSAYFVFPVLLRFSSLIIALQIGKSSFQLWQVTIIPAFILISSGKKFNRSIWIQWIFYCVSLGRQSWAKKGQILLRWLRDSALHLRNLLLWGHLVGIFLSNFESTSDPSFWQLYK